MEQEKIKCKDCGKLTSNTTSEHCDDCKEKNHHRKCSNPDRPYFP